MPHSHLYLNFENADSVKICCTIHLTTLSTSLHHCHQKPVVALLTQSLQNNSINPVVLAYILDRPARSPHIDIILDIVFLHELSSSHHIIHDNTGPWATHLHSIVKVIPPVILIGVNEGETKTFLLSIFHLCLKNWKQVNGCADQNFNSVLIPCCSNILFRNFCAFRIYFNADNPNVRIETRDVDCRVATQCTHFQGVLHTTKLALKGHELCLRGKGGDVLESALGGVRERLV
ncbi:hypothetical protein AO1008_09829 [Aspergillus oryzae 100-8]|uniref:Uncharacterized protein n=1 Tax=Aspergillus oryzae (strain 3.042) TaxID=1160506 RepID=I8U2W4_ASPO3|nr:hypothetical protein Ao3042_02576 [Aspergillus oryzae 3.042]KDE83284.1 hypothetical protein AO1008_09829 [Aspergillus oryzae 100-8]|eukprot:EIT80993.1 hypothetical protein Ao3042_02576 [Aspergillus oryzae 3.042]